MHLGDREIEKPLRRIISSSVEIVGSFGRTFMASFSRTETESAGLCRRTLGEHHFYTAMLEKQIAVVVEEFVAIGPRNRLVQAPPVSLKTMKSLTDVRGPPSRQSTTRLQTICLPGGSPIVERFQPSSDFGMAAPGFPKHFKRRVFREKTFRIPQAGECQRDVRNDQ